MPPLRADGVGVCRHRDAVLDRAVGVPLATHERVPPTNDDPSRAVPVPDRMPSAEHRRSSLLVVTEPRSGTARCSPSRQRDRRPRPRLARKRSRNATGGSPSKRWGDCFLRRAAARRATARGRTSHVPLTRSRDPICPPTDGDRHGHSRRRRRTGSRRSRSWRRAVPASAGPPRPALASTRASRDSRSGPGSAARHAHATRRARRSRRPWLFYGNKLATPRGHPRA